MAIEETLLIKVIVDINQPSKTFNELERKLNELRIALTQVPKAGTTEFDKLAERISSRLGVGIDAAKKKIVEFEDTAKKELTAGTKEVERFRNAFETLPKAAADLDGRFEKTFSGLSSNLKQTFSAISGSDALDKLSREQQQAAKTANELTTAIDKQKTAAKKEFPDGSYKQLSQRLRELRNRFRELTQAELDSQVGQDLANDYKKVNAQLKQLDSRLKTVSGNRNQLRGLFKELNANFGGLFRISNLGSVFTLALGGVQKLQEGLEVLSMTFSATARASRLVEEATQEITGEYAKERAQLDSLFNAAQDINASDEQRADALNKINVVYTDYLPNLVDENTSVKDLKTAYDAVNKSIIENIVQKQKARLIEKGIQEAIDETIEARKAEALATVSTGDLIFDLVRKGDAALQKQQAATATATAANTKFIEDQIRSVLETVSNLDLNFADAFGADGDQEALSIFDEISGKKAALEKEIKELIITNKSYSAQQQQLAAVTRQLTSAEEEFAAATRFGETELQRLNRRRGELEEQVKTLIAADKDYTKQQEELRTVTARLTEIQEKFNAATAVAESRLDSLSKRQQELNKEIQNAIAEGTPYAEKVSELITVTEQLNGINEQFAAVQKEVNDLLNKSATGSAADYENRIKALQEQQAKLSLNSQEYLDLQNQINDLEQQRTVILDALSFSIEEAAKAQTDLNNSLSDQEAQNAAIEDAKARIAAVTDATAEGAKQIEAIETDLQNKLKQIQTDAKNRRISEINAELQALESEKQAELALVSDNTSLQAAIIADFEQQKTELQIEQATIRGELLQQELEQSKVVQAQITENEAEEAEKRKQIQQQVTDAVQQGLQILFQVITAAQQQLTEKQLEEVEKARELELQKAESFGASEEAKLAIQEKFDKKKEEIERKAAERAKAIALSQAAIDISLSILKASASAPPPANLPAIAIASILGAIQLAIIGSQKFALGDIFDLDVRSNGNFSKFAKGAYLRDGAYHSGGGMPILNPFTGQKVAEIEKGEAIINRRSTRMFYDELSYINSVNGNGVSFPNAGKISSYSQLKDSLKQKGLAYAAGGTFNSISGSMLKLQTGAIVAADIQREVNSSEKVGISQSVLLSQINKKLDTLIKVNESGFASIPSTPDELRQISQLLKDENNAS